LLSNKKLLHGLFFCHLTIEKAIKALVAKYTKDFPPKSHNLILLIEKAGITLPKEFEDLHGILMKYQLEGRYPDYSPSIPDNETVNNYLEQTKNLLEWFKSK